MKLSIIIPVYNVERFLPQCLDSVFAQTIDNFEVICIDDGSKDSSLSVLQKYGEEHANLRIIHQENHGLGYTRNVGLDCAKGDYIAFVDSDDFVAPDMFEKMIDKMERTNAEIAISNPYLFDHNTGEIRPYREMLKFYRFSILGGFSPLEHPGVFSFLGAWDKVYKRSFLAEHNIRFPVNRIYEDAPFSYQSLALAKTITVVKECYYYYRKNAGGAITDKERKTDAFKIDFLLNIREIQCFLKEHHLYEQVEEPFIAYVLHDGLFHHSYIRSGRISKRFFREIHEVLNDVRPETIRKINTRRLRWYYKVVCRNQYLECRFVMFLIRNFQNLLRRF